MGGMKCVPLSDAQASLPSLVEEVGRSHVLVTITRHGRPAAVLMAADYLDSLHETLFWLSQPGLREDIAAARQAVASGTGVSSEELRADFGLT